MYVADFETTTNADDCRVWAWGLCEIGNISNFIYGNNISSFFEKMKELSKQQETIYFHNLKFICLIFLNINIVYFCFCYSKF